MPLISASGTREYLVTSTSCDPWAT
jgi:hypothetical protein